MGILLCVLSFFTRCDEGNSNVTWIPRGSDIEGEREGGPTLWGLSVGLSADGFIAAVGGYLSNSETGIRTAYVRVYRFDEDGRGGGQDTPSFFEQLGQWNQFGQDIIGDGFSDPSGISFEIPVALSTDGMTVAVGVPQNEAAGFRSGHVRVYAFDSQLSLWNQLGQDLDGDAEWDEFGGSVDISSDGTIVAIGAPCPEGNCDDTGYVRVLEYQSASAQWFPRGQDLIGEGSGDQFGFSVSLSADGTTLAVGIPYTLNDEVGSPVSGRARVFVYEQSLSASSGQWNQYGQDLVGIVEFGLFGYAVSLSSDGQTVAVSSPFLELVRVWRMQFVIPRWVRLGQDLRAAVDFAELSGFGVTVALSANGRTVVVGDHVVSFLGGHIRVFDYSSFSSQWVQAGPELAGEAAFGRFGRTVALSANGNVVMAGAPNSNNSTGLARAFSRR